MSGISFCSARLMLALVLSQAANEIDRELSASDLIRSFTGEVSSRSMLSPGPKVTISI
jgi:hypothetical protein